MSYHIILKDKESGNTEAWKADLDADDVDWYMKHARSMNAYNNVHVILVYAYEHFGDYSSINLVLNEYRGCGSNLKEDLESL